MKITEGKKVWLKEGGREMLIKDLPQNGLIPCTWWDGKKFQEGQFKEDQLIDENPANYIMDNQIEAIKQRMKNRH